MSSQNTKPSSHKIKVGILIVGGIVLFALGLFLIGSRKQLFAHQYNVYADFNQIDTIQTGATVRVSGMDAGTVADVQIPRQPSQKFRLTLNVDEKFQHIVRQDSVASISTEGMVGNKFVEIKKGTDQSPECQPGCTIHSEEPVEMGTLMRQGNDIANNVKEMLKELRPRVEAAVQNVTDLTGHADKMIVSVGPDVNRVAANAVRISGDARQIVGGVRNGQGVAGKLLVDQTTASDVTSTISNAKQITTNIDDASAKANTMLSDVQQKDMPAVQKTIQNTQDMTGQLNQAVGTFLAKGNNKENTAEALRDTVQNANQTAGNLADDTEAIKHNFFFRGFFNRRGFYSFAHMTPSKYEDSRFVKKPKERVWLPAAGLFQTGPNGQQELTQYGPAMLDQGMSSLVPYLPNNPIMVEAYSEGGAPDQRYRSSQQRAELVRQYLVSHFHLNSKWIGTMAFEDQPPAGAGKTTWNGISLVLIVSK